MSATARKNNIHSSHNGEFITIQYADGKSVFLQGEDAHVLCLRFGGEVPSFLELSKSVHADSYRDIAQ